MRKLLHAGIRRYAISSLFWLALVATVVIAVLCGLKAREAFANEIFITAEYMVIAILLSWIVGREYEEGIFKNKLISGYTKGVIFLSELILGVIISVVFALLFSTIFILCNGYLFSIVPVSILITVFIDFLLTTIGITALFVTISCLLSHRAISAIATIVLAFLLILAGNESHNVFLQRESYSLWEYTYTEVIDENGEVHLEGTPIPGTEQIIMNENYVRGFPRVLAKVAYEILPTGHMMEDMELLYPYFGYDYYEDAWFSMTAEEVQEVSMNPLYAVPFVIVMPMIGFFLFRKKQFK